MPNLAAHLEMAMEGARRLGHPVVKEHLGSFLLGSVSPDIRIITRTERHDTHFAPLDLTVLGEGIRTMLQRYPRLAGGQSLNRPTQAFLAGYMLHLLADEAWIIQVYRPYFGNDKVFKDPRYGSIMDRALQMELDHRAHHFLSGDGLRKQLDGGEEGVEVEFLPADVLFQWREWLGVYLQREFSWGRLRALGKRGLGEDDPDVVEMIEEFLSAVPKGLEEIYARVPPKTVEEYRQATLQAFLIHAGGYLS